MSSGPHPWLIAIAEKLISEFPHTSLRGEGAASFIFVQHNNKAVEISMLDDNHVWVEFWDNALGEDAPPVKDMTINSEDQVLNEVGEWLSSCE